MSATVHPAQENLLDDNSFPAFADGEGSFREILGMKRFHGNVFGMGGEQANMGNADIVPQSIDINCETSRTSDAIDHLLWAPQKSHCVDRITSPGAALYPMWAGGKGVSEAEALKSNTGFELPAIESLPADVHVTD